MNLNEAIKILEFHNKWRRGEIDEIYYSPKQIGLAIDKILKSVKVYQKWRLTSRISENCKATSQK